MLALAEELPSKPARSTRSSVLSSARSAVLVLALDVGALPTTLVGEFILEVWKGSRLAIIQDFVEPILCFVTLVRALAIAILVCRRCVCKKNRD
jgi:hypothetical protein